ncbi:MAG: tyrosine-type recombinase/integrase [Acidobacteria bacterium]|nr:tyrosine-type recombinase/integrase [Acidobacteriota bacterium]
MKLKEVIADYLALRRALSPGFDALEQSLNAFCRVVGEESEITDVTPEQVKAFLDGTGQLTNYWHHKYSGLLGFYRYAIGRGYLASTPLPTVTPQPPPSLVPYIYTRDELSRLFRATSTYRRKHRVLEPYTFRAILLLLYGAGLRVSEALGLTLADVDLTAALLTIRQSKFDKTRLVALGTELTQEMRQYAAQRHQNGHDQSSSAPFFVGRHGERISCGAVEGSFQTLRKSAGICRTDGARYQPRLHDLRHAFAVHRLTTWYQEGKDVQKLLPLLATYLGHIDLASTQIYLTMTPELLDAACERFERYAFQEVSHD